MAVILDYFRSLKCSLQRHICTFLVFKKVPHDANITSTFTKKLCISSLSINSLQMRKVYPFISFFKKKKKNSALCDVINGTNTPLRLITKLPVRCAFSLLRPPPSHLVIALRPQKHEGTTKLNFCSRLQTEGYIFCFL